MSTNNQNKLQQRINLIATFILLLACIFGYARGMKQSVFTIFINNPSEGLPYITIIFVGAIIFYLFLWVTSKKDT